MKATLTMAYTLKQAGFNAKDIENILSTIEIDNIEYTIFDIAVLEDGIRAYYLDNEYDKGEFHHKWVSEDGALCEEIKLTAGREWTH